MATFIETLPREFYREREVIPMIPGVRLEDGNFVDGYTTAAWISDNFADVANATLPLAEEHYQTMKDLGDTWIMNMAQWRKNGVFEVDGIPATDLIEDEETLLAILAEQRQPTEQQVSEEA